MRALTQEQFIAKATQKHDSLYDYSSTVYNGSRESITFKCTVCCNYITMKANNHLSGQGCKQCHIKTAAAKKKISFEDFIIQANSVHNNKYHYPVCEFNNNKTKIVVVCPKHGEFLQTVNHHLRGRGCPSCAIEVTKEKNRNKQNVWSYSGWEAQGLSSKYFEAFTLYIIECWKDNERFVKIGKTFIGVDKRFQGQLPYDWKVIKTITGSAAYINKLEHTLHTLNNKHKYSPSVHFKGDSECFVLTEELIYEPKFNS